MQNRDETGTRILCDDELRVSVGGSGPRALLDVRNDVAVRFWADTEALEGLLPGGELQIDAHGGRCNIHIEGEIGQIELVVEDHTTKACTFPTHDLADALTMVRRLAPTADEDSRWKGYTS